MKIKICPLCVVVSGVWLLIQAGMNAGLLIGEHWILVVALAMGGTVVGIAQQKQSLYWKSIIIVIGMPLAYFFVTHINRETILLEIIILLGFAYHLFVKPPSISNNHTHDLEEKMKNCC